jgi:hypothetical protein
MLLALYQKPIKQVFHEMLCFSKSTTIQAHREFLHNIQGAKCVLICFLNVNKAVSTFEPSKTLKSTPSLLNAQNIFSGSI